jgi:hypothetical protein
MARPDGSDGARPFARPTTVTPRHGWPIDTVLKVLFMTRHTRRSRLLAHPATLALAAAGSSTIELADALGISSSAASLYLAGRRRAPDRLPAVLAKLIGQEAADAVLAAIPTRTGADA